MTEKDCLIALSAFIQFGPSRLKLLLSYFGKPSKVWEANTGEFIEIGLGRRLAEEFEKHRSLFCINKYKSQLSNLNVDAITSYEEGYPENLKKIEDPPFVLYVRGKLKKDDNKAVAIVGTRTMTQYGSVTATKFAQGLAGCGVTIVSGLALGVDAQAQKSAISVGGRTIGVLASGVDIISPLANKSLGLEIINNHGALVSEYPLGHIPFRHDFAVRNRLIAGLAKGVLVIEGKIKSGTFYTVNAALSQGKSVFAVPGPIYSPTSEGPNYLIQNGAVPAMNVGDIMEELDLGNDRPT